MEYHGSRCTTNQGAPAIPQGLLNYYAVLKQMATVHYIKERASPCVLEIMAN